jgi:hypothetical protein
MQVEEILLPVDTLLQILVRDVNTGKEEMQSVPLRNNAQRDNSKASWQ